MVALSTDRRILSATRIAYWDRFGMPPKPPNYGAGLDSWWIDPGKDKSLTERGRN